MKALLGIDFEGSYSFYPGTNTIVFRQLERDISIANILLITNVTANTIIYNFADSTKGAVSFNDSTLVLDYNTSSMNSSDVLQIYLDMPNADTKLLRSIDSLLKSPMGYDKSSSRYRNTVSVETGSISSVSSVSTVSTVSNISTLGLLNAERLLYSANFSAWQSAHRSRIT